MKLQLNSMDDPDLGHWVYRYDLNENLIFQSGGGGNLVSGDGYYREYDGNGKLAGYAEFPRNTSPQRMCAVFKNDADELLKNYPEDMTWEEAVEDADVLRKMALHVPGLNTE